MSCRHRFHFIGRNSIGGFFGRARVNETWDEEVIFICERCGLRKVVPIYKDLEEAGK